MRGALSAKCREPSVKPAEEEASDPIEIIDDEEEPIGEPIPVQIGNRPGVAEREFVKSLARAFARSLSSLLFVQTD